MPRKKKAQLEKFAESLETLYPSGSPIPAEKLRGSFHAHLEAQYNIVKLLRNSIPDAGNSDGRNLLQGLTDNLLTHLSELSTHIGILTNRQIKEYKVVRVEKYLKYKAAAKAARRAARKAAKEAPSSSSAAHDQKKVRRTRE